MKTINPNTVHGQITDCYMKYDPNWECNGNDRMGGFKHHLENTAGIKLDLIPEDRFGKHGYKIKQVEIVNEPKFTMWMLKWS